MIKRLASIGLLSLLSASAAHAANCSAYTYTLTNGTSADANQVMSNFNNILNCANNNLLAASGGTITGLTTLPGSGQITSAGLFSIGAANDGSALIEARKDQNAPTVGVKIMNFGSGASVQARFDLATVTANSYSLIALQDNSGAPFWQLAAGSAVQNAYFDLPNQIFRTSGGTERMRITSGGSVGIAISSPSLLFQVNGTAGGSSAWQVVSDARLKKDIQPLANGLGMVSRLNPVSYDWKDAKERTVGKALSLSTGERQLGFLAQEVEKVVPEAVSKPKDSDGVYTLKQETLIPVLVAAIKEQQAEIEQLQAKLAALTPTTQH